MNIFVLSEDPGEAARYQCNKHVVKMILESAQLLSTAHHLLSPKEFVAPCLCRPTHKNHPCSKWVRSSKENYLWLYRHFVELCKEYTFRYGKRHKYDNSEMHRHLAMTPSNIPQDSLTPFVMAMPEQYKNKNVVEAYRAYYIHEKQKFAEWKNREIPHWFRKTI